MKKSILFLLVILFTARLGLAQTAPVMYSVHEDIVKPSMDVQYRETMKKLKAACELHKISFGWNTVSFDDGSYRHLATIKSFAELEKNPFADLEAKMGKEALGKLWAEFDACVESHNDFVMITMPQFAYLAPTSEENYRDITYWTPLPGKEAEAEAILGEWKKLNESKKVPGGYTVSKVIFGRDLAYSIVSFGKDALDCETKSKKSNELLGEEAGKLWAKTMTVTKKYFSKRANMRPEFSYTAAK